MCFSGLACPEVASHHVQVDAPATGHKIRRARESKGWNQQDLADALTRQRGGRRVGVRSVGRWERGETLPRNAIGALEAVLGVSLDGNDPGVPDAGEAELREALMAIARGGLMTAEDVEAVVASYRRRRNLPPQTRAG